jgi:uncharacterized protein YjbI with pentapeptide repeats
MPYPVKFSYLRNSDLTTPPHGLPQVQYEDGSSHEPEARRVDAQEELQVRLTAQAILLRHLRDNQDADLPDAEPDMYWPGIEIDLSGATLVNWTCSEVRFSGASFFHGAKFIGPAFFHKVRFELVASFNDCRFTEWVEFRESTFAHSVYFGSSLFADATFVDVTFSLADFGNATFDNALFRETSFKNRAVFERATFRQSAMFDRIRFTSIIYFRGAKFHKNASFSNILFGGETFFSRALFEGPTLLDSLAFVEKVWFDGVTLPVNTSFRGCYVAKPRKDRHDEWPTGWETNFEESDEVWGSLRRIGQSESESENPGATSFPSP